MSTGGNKTYRPDGLHRSVQGRVHIWDSGNIIADLLSRIIYSASARICSRRRRGGAYRENSDMFVSSRARKRRGAPIDSGASSLAFAAVCFGDPGAWICASLLLLIPLFRYITGKKYKNTV